MSDQVRNDMFTLTARSVQEAFKIKASKLFWRSYFTNILLIYFQSLTIRVKNEA